MACIWKGWEDLNEKYDNYRYPVDCYDPKTGFYHQVKGKIYDFVRMSWEQYWGNSYNTEFISLILFCISEDEKNVDRIYEFPKKEVAIRKTVEIFDNDNIHWYDEYRITDKEELKKVNKIWKEIINGE